MPGTSDILMMLVKGGSAGIPGESQAVLSPSDLLLNGPPKFEVTKFFELDSFTITIRAEPSDSQQEDKQSVNVHVATGSKAAPRMQQKIGKNTTWQPGLVEEISCTRQIDHASPYLFEQCGNATLFDKAAIVRRKVVGGTLAASNKDNFLMSYMRLDFEKVTITNLVWSSDDDGVKETFQFACQKAVVVYRQQQHTGSLLEKQFPPGKWPL